MQNDLISRSLLLAVGNVRKVTEYDEGGWGLTYRAVPEQAIKNAPAVDAVPVVHARWEKLKHDTYCSACGEFLPSITYIQGGYNGTWQCCEEIEKTRYCPNCGAKMDGGAENGVD